ncbi:transcription elongation factor A protein 3 isoform X2 [Notolabrus celidotus]|uniref:transcription elongation factor A protein 3 isoform X2 n=1 Tax=Notolabrus celidotus TaxID=1203425 RepID=UPI0014901416|nr:transcription elongation factor A protein 3 isoform X2 [Notolabrus celidotus]
MTREEDLIRIAKKLDKMVSRNNTEGAIDLLRELKAFNMSLKLLQETRIGMSVNGIRKHCTDEEVIALAKVLIKDWKRLLDSGPSQDEKPADMKNGLDSSKTVTSPHSSPSDTHSSHRNLDVKPKQDADPDKRHPDIDRKEKHNDEHKNKERHSDDPGHEKPPLEHQNEKNSQEIRERGREKHLEELQKHRTVENHKVDMDNKKQKHVQDLQNEKHKPEPSRERPFEEPKKMRLMDEVKKEKHQEELKKHSYSYDTKREKHREDSRHERPINTLHRERPPCEKPADVHKPLFERKDSSDSKVPKKHSDEAKTERKDSCDSKPGQPVKRQSSDSKPDRRESTDSKKSSSPPAKKLTTERRESQGSKTSQPVPPQRKPSTDSVERKSKMDTPKSPTTPTSPMSPSFSSAGGPLSPHLSTGETIRDKCIELLSAALRTDNYYKDYGTNCDSMAAEIEDHIYQEIKATDMKYKNRVRSRISNLKDPKNPGLRRNVLAGSIELSRIASMTTEEMASDELKQLRNVLTQEAIREHQMAKTGGTSTDLLQCDKCKKKNCTYNQVQTRSADEPMTTFVLCNECGNRWKFC